MDKCIFVFYNVKDKIELFITYGIINQSEKHPMFENTISIHRKKQTTIARCFIKTTSFTTLDVFFSVRQIRLKFKINIVYIVVI